MAIVGAVVLAGGSAATFSRGGAWWSDPGVAGAGWLCGMSAAIGLGAALLAASLRAAWAGARILSFLLGTALVIASAVLLSQQGYSPAWLVGLSSGGGLVLYALGPIFEIFR